jgi:TonB-dependent receptor
MNRSAGLPAREIADKNVRTPNRGAPAPALRLATRPLAALFSLLILHFAFAADAVAADAAIPTAYRPLVQAVTAMPWRAAIGKTTSTFTFHPDFTYTENYWGKDKTGTWKIATTASITALTPEGNALTFHLERKNTRLRRNDNIIWQRLDQDPVFRAATATSWTAQIGKNTSTFTFHPDGAYTENWLGKDKRGTWSLTAPNALTARTPEGGALIFTHDPKTPAKLNRGKLPYTAIPLAATPAPIAPDLASGRASVNAPASTPSPVAPGLASGRATITGRVLNAATGMYLKSAEVRLAGTNHYVYSEDGGSYSITVPAGEATLTASYTSVRSATVTLNLAPGATATADFELQALVLDSRTRADAHAAAAGTSVAGDIVLLDRFVVSEERSGQAKAIQEQKAAPNAITIIATDNFGDITQGNVGEFLKYMPGITLDNDDGEAYAVRVNGLDPKYSSFSLDGIQLASGASNANRAVTFTQISITGIESIEFNQTLTASMEAGSGAGAFNMRSKYAFNLKKPVLRFQFGLDGTTDGIEIGRAYLPDDRKHDRTFPGGQVNYGASFLKNRLGVEASASRYVTYYLNQGHETHYAYRIPDADLNPGYDFTDEPEILRLNWSDRPRIMTRTAANLSLDFKFTQHTTLSLRTSYTITDNDYYHLYYNLLAQDDSSTSDNYTGPAPWVRPESDLIHWYVDPTSPTSAHTTLYTGNSLRLVHDENYLVSPRITYKKGPTQIELRGGYSDSRRKYSDGEEGYFQAITDRVNGIGWTATRSSPSSPAWTLTQTAGTDWSQPQNWNRGFNQWYGVTTRPSRLSDKMASLYLDLTRAFRVLNHPVTFKTGLAHRRRTFHWDEQNQRMNYLGPNDRQVENPIPVTQNYIFDLDLKGRSGNIPDQGWRVDDNHTLWSIYQAHPEWFAQDELTNYRNALINRRDLKEKISGAYIEATSRFNRLQLNAGIRAERTETEALVMRMKPFEQIDAERATATPEQIATGMFDYSVNAENGKSMTYTTGVDNQYHNGRLFPRTRSYTNVFLSGGAKYDLSRNLRGQLSASQSIIRPDFGNLAAVPNWNGISDTIWVPNPRLKPEKLTKIYAGLHWYLNPAGKLSASATRLYITDKQISPIDITEEQADRQTGYSLREAVNLDGAIADVIRYRSVINAPGTRHIDEFTLEYDQQLTFLPGVLKGLAVFGSFSYRTFKGQPDLQTQRENDREKINFKPRQAAGGIKYRYGLFNLYIRAAWEDDRLADVNIPVAYRRWVQNDYVYRKDRLTIDLSGGLKLNRNLELAFSIRNLTNEADIWYSDTKSRLMRYNIYGTTWNLSLKGSY